MCTSPEAGQVEELEVTEQDEKQLRVLLFWLAVYVSAVVGVGWATNKLPDALALLQNIASGLFGAAMAMMRQTRGPQ
jgi:hypothetical protein